MEPLAYVIRDAIPSYLKNVPVPRSFKGFLDLSFKDWIHLISFSAAVGGAGYFAIKPYYEKYSGKQKLNKINFNVGKTKPKVCDMMDVEDLGDKTVLCRCWQSKKFPYCDGSHMNFNAATGDNIAPVVLQRKQKNG